MFNNKGVTLTELLIVVIIMGIIAGIAIPLIGDISEKAEKDAVLGEMISIEEAATTYCLIEQDAGCDYNNELKAFNIDVNKSNDYSDDFIVVDDLINAGYLEELSFTKNSEQTYAYRTISGWYVSYWNVEGEYYLSPSTPIIPSQSNRDYIVIR